MKYQIDNEYILNGERRHLIHAHTELKAIQHFGFDSPNGHHFWGDIYVVMDKHLWI